MLGVSGGTGIITTGPRSPLRSDGSKSYFDVPSSCVRMCCKTRGFIQGIKAGEGSLEELLTTALSELCKVKPEGLDAVRYLLVVSANSKRTCVGRLVTSC